MPAERFDFPNAAGQRLAALLDYPEGKPRACALFAHCFTCGKDAHAGRRIAEGLKALGIAVLRFDFTGLGSSEGEFANTTFSSNVHDLVAAANHLRATHAAPAVLIGHSLGGAAVLAASGEIPEARAVVTIAAPSDPGHVTGLFREHIDAIRAEGEVEVALAGRPFRIRREFVDDIREQRLTERVAQLRKALLIFHSPTDDTVGIENAGAIFGAAKHPKSFISLAGADHLLSRRSDAAYVANVIAAWAERYLDMAPVAEAIPDTEGGVQVTETRMGKFEQLVRVGQHRFFADEPLSVGGLDSGPSPYDLLLAGLGACTAMTVRLYAERKALPLDHVSVALAHGKIHAADCENCETKVGMIDRIDRTITFEGALDEGQRAKLLEIADKCPVHRTLTSEIEIPHDRTARVAMIGGVVILGAGQAAAQLAASLRQGGYAAPIRMIGDEPFPPYQRPPLSKKFLADRLAPDRLYLRPEKFWHDHHITLDLGVRAKTIDRRTRHAVLSDGREIAFETLVLATGTRAAVPPVPGRDLAGVFFVRRIEDIQRLRLALDAAQRVVIVGGGYIGLEVAAVMRAEGRAVTVLEAEERVMKRVTSPAVSAFFDRFHRARGVDVRLGTRLAAIEGDAHVESVRLAAGDALPADLMLVATGARPNDELAAQAGLACEDGVAVDEFARTGDPAIYAIGDCTRFPSARYGRRVRLECVQNAIDQAKAAASAILGKPQRYDPVPWFWSDQYEVKLQMAGLCDGFDEARTVGDPTAGRFSVEYRRGDRLIAVDAINDGRAYMAGRQRLAQETA